MATFKVFGAPEDIEAESEEDALMKYELKGAVIQQPLVDDEDEDAPWVITECQYAHGKEGGTSDDCRCLRCVSTTIDVMADLGFFERHDDGQYSLRKVMWNGQEEDFVVVFRVWAREAFGIEVE